ncbi:MAG: hydroxymethylglutaryl-CoA lyase [Ktedonobacteraceae bacterium]
MTTAGKFSIPDPVAAWPESITVVDVTARDGLQDADRLITTAQKLQLVRDLIDAGVRHIEVTSFVHPRWVPQMADADQLVTSLPRRDDVTYSVLVPNMRGYERAKAAGSTEVALVVSASESHNKANLNRSIAETLAQLSEVAAHAQADGIALRGAISTAFGCPFEGDVAEAAVERVARAYVEMGVQQIALADTIGVGNPHQVFALFNRIRSEVPGATSLVGHFHDRRGYGLANVFAAMQAGVTRFDVALGGLGGCPYAPGAPGNLATEVMVEFLHAMGLKTGIELAALTNAHSRLMNALANGEVVKNSHSIDE